MTDKELREIVERKIEIKDKLKFYTVLIVEFALFVGVFYTAVLIRNYL